MLKQSITYEDFNGNKQTKDFYFNLSKAEVAEMELSTKDGLSEALKAVIATEDPKQIVQTFKDWVLRAYGEKSEDGQRFVKNDQLREEFQQTNAYSELFMLLATDADAAAKFMKGILPADMGIDAGPQDHKAKETPALGRAEIVETPPTSIDSAVNDAADRVAFEQWKASQGQ
jgi:hypothetical protein